MSGARVYGLLGVRDERGAPCYDRLLMGTRQGDIARPATLLIGEGGRIRMFYRADRVDSRPELSSILKLLEK